MSSEGLIPVRVESVSNASHLAWAEGMQFCLPCSTLEESRLIEHIDSEGNLVVPTEIPPIASSEVDALRLWAAFTDQKPASSRLPVYYQRISPRIRGLIASAIGRWKRHRVDRWAAFPKWPVDLSADFLADLASGRPSPFAARPTPVLLTHDLDSAEGLENLVKLFLDMEESVGARSTSFIVPCAWPIDHKLLAHVKERGHEIGIHGYDHGNRTPFLDADQRRKRLEEAHNLIERYEIKGYRSPSILRTRNLLRDLAHFYCYDSSIPTSGGLFPVPNTGCASARPFCVEGIAEIPLSMPRDASLCFMGYSPRQIVDLWIQSAEQISQSGGVVVLLTHCDSRFSGKPAILEAYRCFLDYLASSERYAWSTPKEILGQALACFRHHWPV